MYRHDLNFIDSALNVDSSREPFKNAHLFFLVWHVTRCIFSLPLPA